MRNDFVPYAIQLANPCDVSADAELVSSGDVSVMLYDDAGCSPGFMSSSHVK